MLRRPALLITALAGASALLVAGCAPQDETAGAGAASAGGSASTTASCSPTDLQTLTPGTFTVATSQPAYEPWFSDDDPSNGQGFESAVAYAVAGQLGYSKEQVTWTVADFNAAIAPGPKQFDVDINQFSITEERKQAVDFSTPYYDVAQAVVTDGASKAASVTDLAGLKDLRLGAQVGTTSYTAITDQVQPTQQPSVFNTNDDAVAALKNGQVDAIVVDLPTAFYMAAAQLDAGKVVGQLATPSGGATDTFGMVLDKGSPLTACVSRAVDTLREDGTLAKLQQEWLDEAAQAPVLT
ncbi:amino acid ABC transporter substrate-binding protein [Streptomyces sp. NP160]|uniref:ABC transporter substrate-binding protein n=1 Tax=Streptomyces sp. NP160 TaxID=2586637 RepID=UPI001119ED7B|nr:ABC transporter substrate-binding protein [Streptomyces sp. NP160]TNM62464.1 amino acid ABC transporter substrate-binding protein [Streptomyces sp. NP160]